MFHWITTLHYSIDYPVAVLIQHAPKIVACYRYTRLSYYGNAKGELKKLFYCFKRRLLLNENIFYRHILWFLLFLIMIRNVRSCCLLRASAISVLTLVSRSTIFWISAISLLAAIFSASLLFILRFLEERLRILLSVLIFCLLVWKSNFECNSEQRRKRYLYGWFFVVNDTQTINIKSINVLLNDFLNDILRINVS